MKAVFIRHKLGKVPEILDDLWAKREIALHYGNIRSTDPDRYQNPGKLSLRRLHSYCKSGAIVGASYRLIRPTEMLVGIIPAGSKIKWTDEYGADYIYKTVQLEKAKVISYLDYPLLAAIRPRLAALTGWPTASPYLHAILGLEEIHRDVGSLAPGQLEVICFEYLRMKERIAVLLLPLGRNLPDVDIFGMAKNRQHIIAQVTHSDDVKNISNKMSRLKHYKKGDNTLIFFGPEKYQFHDPSIEYIPIERVFSALSSSGDESIYAHLISTMLTWDKMV